jgi:hypothetical protein
MSNDITGQCKKKKYVNKHEKNSTLLVIQEIQKYSVMAFFSIIGKVFCVFKNTNIWCYHRRE